MTRPELKKLLEQGADWEAVGLLDLGAPQEPCFCTPVGAQPLARLGADGVHFILLPGDARVFCVDPAMGEPGTYVLPVAEDLREFLAFVLFCRDASPLSQIRWLTEERFRQLLAEDAAASWPGCETFFARKEAALAAIAETFALAAADPFAKVKAMQNAFDPAVLRFSDEYYEVLGLERKS